MKTNRRIALLAVVCCLGAGMGVSTSAMRAPRIELLNAVRVAGADVLLSDLLPAGVDGSLRVQAGEVSLGAAPQPGTTRILERSGVLENISAGMDIGAEIAVPERITVSREARLITFQEVFSAIQDALGRNASSVGTTLRPEDVLLQTQVLVAPGDAGLQILRSDFDPVLKRGRFLLRASRDPQILPFLVAVRFAANSPPSPFDAVAAMSRKPREPEHASVPAAPVKPEFLVTPGETATLLLESDALRMTADVVPLEKGMMGQSVQVRVVDTGKVFSARVDGRAHLESNF
jgi:hypothetical protein